MYLTCCVLFFNDTATSEIYTLSLHDALPILPEAPRDSYIKVVRPESLNSYISWFRNVELAPERFDELRNFFGRQLDRKSTRLNSSHRCISYAVFCLKKKKNNSIQLQPE